jgi:hypothetical protein
MPLMKFKQYRFRLVNSIYKASTNYKLFRGFSKGFDEAKLKDIR